MFETSRRLGAKRGTVLIVEPSYVEVAKKAASDASHELRLLVFGADDDQDLLFTAAVNPIELTTRPVAETTANIQYTSGTTGLPKGCVLSHLYWCRLARIVAAGPPHLGFDDVLMTAQPFYYMDPQWNMVVALMTGATLIIAPRFSASNFWSQVRRNRVTFFYCLGMMPAALYAQPVDPDETDHQLRAVLVSGIPAPLHQPIEERFQVKWYEAYGMTETGGDLRMFEQDHDKLIGSGAIGRPYSDREVRVIDDAGGAVARGKEGELVVRGPGIMDGYFDDADATARILRGGWVHTGDVVAQDLDGIVSFVGRTKDMIRRSGENVAALEVERVVSRHPKVRAVACVPEPDAMRGEEIKVFVVFESNSTDTDDVASLAEIRAWCTDQLAYFKIPRYWSVIDSLPMTPSERVAKGQLAALATELGLPVWDSTAAP